MRTFNQKWYRGFVKKTSEKKVLAKKLKQLIGLRKREKCLEIGTGTMHFLAQQLHSRFLEYYSVEKITVRGKKPDPASDPYAASTACAPYLTRKTCLESYIYLNTVSLVQSEG